MLLDSDFIVPVDSKFVLDLRYDLMKWFSTTCFSMLGGMGEKFGQRVVFGFWLGQKLLYSSDKVVNYKKP